MALRLHWELAYLPNVSAIVAMLALAGALAYFGFNHRATRIFIVFLALRAIASLAATMRGAHTFDVPNVANASFWAAVFPYFIIPVPFLMLAFAAIYPNPRRWLGGRQVPKPVWWGVGVGALVIVLVFELLHATNHAYWNVDAIAVGPSGGWVPNGPHVFLLGATNLSYGLLAAIFARDAYRYRGSDVGTSLLLVSTGCGINALYDGLGVIVFFNAFDITPEVSDVLTALAVIPVVVAGIIMGVQARMPVASGGGVARRALGLLIGSLSLQLVLIADALGWLGASPDNLFSVLNGLTRLSLPALVTYALLRHQMFDIDLKVKWSVTQGTVAAILYAVFFVISETIEQLLDVDGLWFGIGAAAVVALALKPLQSRAGRIAEVLFPGVRPERSYVDGQKLDLYETTYESIVWDGEMSPKEARSLALLREKLGLPLADCSARERAVRDRLGLEEHLAASVSDDAVA